jgi:predicted DNA-binding protein (UPF0251 family)
MYHVEEMMQSDVAQVMGVGRVSVARMLSQARALANSASRSSVASPISSPTK